MKTFKSAYEKNTVPIIERLKKQKSRYYDGNLIDKIRRDSITLRRLYEYECNGCTREKLPFETWQEYDAAREIQLKWVEERVEKVRARIEKNVKAVGLYIYHQTDPRGCAIYISNNPIPDNSYSTDAIAVC